MVLKFQHLFLLRLKRLIVKLEEFWKFEKGFYPILNKLQWFFFSVRAFLLRAIFFCCNVSPWGDFLGKKFLKRCWMILFFFSFTDFIFGCIRICFVRILKLENLVQNLFRLLYILFQNKKYLIELAIWRKFILMQYFELLSVKRLLLIYNQCVIKIFDLVNHF